MAERSYYSARTGKHLEKVKLDLDRFKKLFLPVYRSFDQQHYFQEAFGYYCVDAGDVIGSAGQPMEGAMLLALRKMDLWPIEERLVNYSEDDLFDVIEFLHDHVSKPVDGYYHSYFGCGWHYSKFNAAEGRAEFRTAVNQILPLLDEGFTLSDAGHVLQLPDPGLEALVEAELPPADESNVHARVAAAIKRFRRHRSSLEDRRHAVRDLADVLEFLRPQAKKVLASKDEGDLFNLANNFGIRHHNDAQRTDYDAPVWLSWMFYYYLATIHAVLRLLERQRDEA